MIRKETFKTRAEWLERRESRPVLGSSDFGIILGLSEYVTPLQYWERKTKGSDEMNANMHRGIFMEDAIAKWFESETGCEIIKRSASYDVYTNDEFPDFVECSPDREAFKQEWEDRPVVEIKDILLRIAPARQRVENGDFRSSEIGFVTQNMNYGNNH